MEKVDLTIIETSDIHGNVYPHSYSNHESLPLGLARISTYIKQERSKKENLLLIDNGDLIQGTPLTYHYVKKLSEQKNPMIKLLNALSFDAAIVGNHEFNYGKDILIKAVDESNFPWLSANILNQDTNEPFFGNSYIIKSFAGVKVAILGATTHYIPNWEEPEHIKGIHFEDALETIKKWVREIREVEKPDILLVSYHGGFERDIVTGEETEAPTGENQAYRICKEVGEIDILLTGHQHRQIASELNGVLILQPGFNGQAVGKIELTLSQQEHTMKWKIDRSSVKVDPLDTYEIDHEILECVNEYEEAAQAWLDQPIGHIQGDMEIHDPFSLRLEDNPLIEFINKVQMEAAGVDISNTALFHNHSPGFKESVTIRDIVSNYIYPNTLKVIRLKGHDIKGALERSATYFTLTEEGEIKVNPTFSSPKPQHYNYDMWEGIDYILDISQPVGERVVKLVYKGMPMNLHKEYDVVMNNYRAGGGGEYTMFKGKPVIKDIPLDMSELIANYLLEFKTFKATVNHNWKVIW
ncbi:bifunctional metallophosphatase/5'-nucleotidase [Metabacillus arenae]|uniref:Bifunctional metallophosphatase/5'-nucleotidase n=1 Tax=Metabacillus arenae TaxID=2771434 RepID=A0A926NA43_9BACI|nr:bifunctional UDP-sugar hydrolase/5'-nucleotidase [Metabacillus arenae]MBD1380377.1 bifunctional metallophosphatase/5'-nucleotidase [Metabacillus arenae]